MMVERAGELADEIHAPGVRDVYADMTSLTLDIVVRTLLGQKSARADDVGRTVGTLLSAYRDAYIGVQRVLPDWVPTRSRRAFRHAGERIDVVLAAIIRDARAGGVEGESNLLARLLAATDDEARA